MELAPVIAAYNAALYDTDRDAALQVIQGAVDAGVSAEDVVFGIVIPAIEQTIGAIGHGAEPNLAQHFMIAQIAGEVTEAMLPRFRQSPESIGRIVIGTAYGDLHSLGKRIVLGCLKARMIDTLDLGVNVAPERFVDAAVAHQAQVIGVSAMMVHTARGENGCRRVRQLLAERQLEAQIKIIVGGAPYRFDPLLYQKVGADAWAPDAILAGKVIAELIREVRR